MNAAIQAAEVDNCDLGEDTPFRLMFRQNRGMSGRVGGVCVFITCSLLIFFSDFILATERRVIMAF